MSNDSYYKMLKSMKKIQSFAWLESRSIETSNKKIRPKLTPRYFGVLTLRIPNLFFQGSFLKFKKVNLKIPLSRIRKVDCLMGKLRIKFINNHRIIENILFSIGEKEITIVPSPRAAEFWSKLILKAKEILEKK
ncbi:MAG: hypothetical protein ACP6IQ_01255 [Candidatus Njordarchaeia archaeon]|nr:hypothetical protein [Candidatus Korarchaeota archaeon]